MTPAQLRISKADPSSLDTVLAILDEATVRLLKNGMPTAWEAGKFSRQAFLDQIEKGEVHIAFVGSEAAGTFILQWSDLLWWGERPDEAGYIHKFAIKPSFAGKGLGVEMVKWAEATAKKAGKKFLRLNCMADDRKIRDYYERLGFIHKGDVMGPKCLGSLYEKRL
ncbi:GNAT family N-acetyltransferase [Candidatus Bathyarchaeota archaeon]|nr:GNAT family N-acetyltransferase [Candidatus Bathyarchaeota archaeon]